MATQNRSAGGSADPRPDVFLTAALAVGLSADFGASAAAQAVAVPEIVIYANQAPIEASKVGAAVSVITGADLRARGAVTVADALRSVPGLAVSQQGTRGSLTQVRVRGAEANHTLVLVDDVPVNDISNGDFNFADFAVEDIERIEVVRGPQSGIYGANAHAGLISIVTKSGRGLARPQASVRLEGGSRNTGSVGASARGAAGPIYGSISVDHVTTSGFNVSRFGDERDASRATTATAKAGIDFTPQFNVEGSVRSVRRFAETDSQPFFGPFEGLAFDSVPDFNRFSSVAARIAATWSLFDGALVQRFSAKRYDERRHDDDVVFGFFRSRGIRDNLDYKATATGHTQVIGGERHSFTIAADRQVETLEIDSASFAFDPPSAAFWASGASRERNGLAGEYVLDLPVGLTLTGALRHDWNSGFEDVATWRVTASQKLPTATRLHGSVGTGVTNPTFIEQYGFFVGTFRGNPALRPERSTGWDAGIEQTLFDGRFVVDATYFGSDFTDKIEIVSAGGGVISTVANIAGISKRRGVEITAKANPLDWLTLAASYTYTDSRLANGTPEVRRPRHAASGSLTVSFPGGRGKASVHAVYNGAMPDHWFKFPIVPVTLQAYTVVGGTISYDVTPWSTVYLRAENIFDASYEEVFSYRAPGFAAYAGLRLRLE
jgi:vitamin B12 transporter